MVFFLDASAQFHPPVGDGKPGWAYAVEERNGTVHVKCLGHDHTCVVYHTPPVGGGPYAATVKDGKGKGSDLRFTFTGVSEKGIRENGQAGVELIFNEAREY